MIIWYESSTFRSFVFREKFLCVERNSGLKREILYAGISSEQPV
jgi:hypothetical protein